MQDTICALATPTGGALAIVRVSGPEAIAITSKLAAAPLVGRRLLHTTITGPDGEEIDDVIITIYHAPHSYTGEDSVEISCHGSAYIATRILQLLIDAGARQAAPGEYTMRAFAAGKLDLSQAEAVADIIAAGTKAQHDVALSQMRGGYADSLKDLREQLLHISSLVELELDFSDQDVQFADRTELLRLCHDTKAHIASLTDTFVAGQAIRHGIPVAIVGKPNVGKSTLLNALLGEERAIVSQIPGTTRDTIEDTATIGGLTFRFIDTAGLRHTDDPIEQIGIDRARKAMQRAAITIMLTDTDDEPAPADLPAATILVRNKADLCSVRSEELGVRSGSHDATASAHSSFLTPHSSLLSISAKYGTGLDTLRQRLVEAAAMPDISARTAIVSNQRHYDALTRAAKYLAAVEQGLEASTPTDLISEDLRAAIDQLNQIFGQSIETKDTLNNIFKHFCVGK